MIEKLFEMEKKIGVEKIIYEKENIWPFFRNKLGGSLVISEYVSGKVKDNKWKNRFRIIQLFIIDIFKLRYLLKKYDYIYFTTPDDYREVDGKVINRLTSEFTSHKKNYKILEIQSGYCIKKDIEDTNIDYMSNASLLVIKVFISKFIKIKSSYAHISFALNQNNAKLNAEVVIREYLSNKLIYTFIYKRVKPKTIVTTCYTFMPAVKFANDLYIKTLEFQHGKILEHFAYTLQEDINNNFYPKVIAVFGKQDYNYMLNTHYIKDKNSIFPIGNILIEHYVNKKNDDILCLKNKYSQLIACSLQWTVLDVVIEYIIKQAKDNENYCFILIPRKEEELDLYNLNIENIKVFPALTCYEIVANSDYHFTVSSTCAHEAPSLGIKNIFFNIDNLSQKSFSNYISSFDFNYLLNETENISDIIEQDMLINKQKIIEDNIDVLQFNYKNNIQNISELF